VAAVARSVESEDVLVVGGGVIGLTVALELSRRGCRVTLIERGEAVGSECSYGSAGLIRRSHPEPLANPTSVLAGLKSMRRPDSTMYIPARLSILPWLTRFAWASRPNQLARSRVVMEELAKASVRLHREYCDMGIQTGYRQSGVLEVYESYRSFQRACASLPRGIVGGHAEVLSPSDIEEVAPLKNSAVTGGILFTEDGYCDPKQYMRAVEAELAPRGVSVRTGSCVKGLKVRKGRVVSVETSAGDFSPEYVVLAAGVWSEEIGRLAGLELLLQAGKGYHVDYVTDGRFMDVPLQISDAHVIATPFDGFLRLAGTMELTSEMSQMSEFRVGAIIAAGEKYLGIRDLRIAETWAGLRPMSADGLPLVGWSGRADNLVIATGHGMEGLRLAPVTGNIVADLLTESPAKVELKAGLDPGRFEGVLSSVLQRVRKIEAKRGADQYSDLSEQIAGG
jgi:D-amino-acid dehydrogenase